MKNLWQQLIGLFYALWARWLQQTSPSPPPPAPDKPFDLTTALAGLIASRTTTAVTRYYTMPDGSQAITAYIPALSSAEALQNAQLLIAACTQAGLLDELVFIVAAMYQESRWAAAYNHNLAESKGVISFAGTDWGQGQFSGKEVLQWPQFQGLTEAQMQAKLMDPTFSIPEFVRMYAVKLKSARTLVTPAVIAQMDKLPSWCMTPTSSLVEMQEWYACVAYNAGDHGVQEILASGGYKTNSAGQQVAEHHGQEIQTWMSQFRPYLEPFHVSAAA